MAKTGISAVAAAGFLASGGVEASAQQSDNETQAGAEIVLASSEVAALTRADCLALDTRAKLTCLRGVQAAEITLKREQRAKNAEVIADNEEADQARDAANEARRERNATLIAELKGEEAPQE